MIALVLIEGVDSISIISKVIIDTIITLLKTRLI